jgi:4-hydroxybenzoate polyprenyl transferase
MIAQSKIQSYLALLRFHQPVGYWLLFWPCAWGITLAPNSQFPIPNALLLALFFLGSVLMRSAGCIINDLWDRDFDRQVERTKTRPLASGAIAPKQAFIVLAVLLLLSLWIVLQLPIIVFWLALAALPLVVAYPLMKRIMWWPQLFLGFTFNYGALMGWAALRGTIEPPALWLYAGGICWTLIYDTIYAHQDITDDAKIGVKSTARLFAENTQIWLTGFALLMLVCFAMAGVDFRTLPLLAVPLAIQLWRLDISDPARCGRQFRFHALFGALIWAILLV